MANNNGVSDALKGVYQVRYTPAPVPLDERINQVATDLWRVLGGDGEYLGQVSNVLLNNVGSLDDLKKAISFAIKANFISEADPLLALFNNVQQKPIDVLHEHHPLRTIDIPPASRPSYDDRFANLKNPIHRQDWRLLWYSINEAAKELKEGDTLSVLDFGCGNGRYLQFYEFAAKQLEKSGINLHVVGYEPIDSGLATFGHRLKGQGYHDEIGEKYDGNAHNSYSKEGSNLSFRLIKGELGYNAQDIQSLLQSQGYQEFNVSASMFGSLDHIREYPRLEIMKLLSDLSKKGQFCFTVSGTREFKSTMTYVDGDEPGSVLYRPGDRPDLQPSEYIFYRLYENRSAVREELEKAGVNIGDNPFAVGVVSVGGVEKNTPGRWTESKDTAGKDSRAVVWSNLKHHESGQEEPVGYYYAVSPDVAKALEKFYIGTDNHVGITQIRNNLDTHHNEIVKLKESKKPKTPEEKESIRQAVQENRQRKEATRLAIELEREI